MAQQRALPQSKETLLQSYNKRLKDDIKSIMDNFTEIIKTAKVGGAAVCTCWRGQRAQDRPALVPRSQSTLTRGIQLQWALAPMWGALGGWTMTGQQTHRSPDCQAQPQWQAWRRLGRDLVSQCFGVRVLGPGEDWMGWSVHSGYPGHGSYFQ